MTKTVIVGGGWAGLAAAVELTRQGVQVTLLESARSCGGRARRVVYRGMPFDNGQHLMIGAYQQTLRLLKICGVAPDQALLRAPLHFSFYGDGAAPKGEVQRAIRLPRLPAPLHMASGILMATGMSWSTRYQLITASLRFMLKRFQLPADCSVDELLRQAGQDSQTISALWQPLCLATLNTPTHLASAEIFLRVLRDSFTRTYRDSDTMLARSDLTALLVDPAIRYIRAHGGEVHSAARVHEISLNHSGVTGVVSNGTTIEAKNLILATPPAQAAKLLQQHTQAHPLLNPLVVALQRFEYQPIITLYLQYDEAARLPQPFVGFDGTLIQWLFDRHLCGQAGVMAAVISAAGEHSSWSRQQLTAVVTAEIANHFPALGKPRDSWLLHDRHATFAATVGVNTIRPANQTAINGLWLAGDYTATGYPATLEGAILSGVAAGRGIIAQNIRK
jgi:squalene-associated FAD-dependent desaturase